MASGLMPRSGKETPSKFPSWDGSMVGKADLRSEAGGADSRNERSGDITFSFNLRGRRFGGSILADFKLLKPIGERASKTGVLTGLQYPGSRFDFLFILRQGGFFSGSKFRLLNILEEIQRGGWSIIDNRIQPILILDFCRGRNDFGNFLCGKFDRCRQILTDGFLGGEN